MENGKRETANGDESDGQAATRSALAKLYHHAHGFVDTMLLDCAMRLDIFHIVKKKAGTVEEIADAVSKTNGGAAVDGSRLRRILRYLVFLGLLSKDASGAYGLTLASSFMLTPPIPSFDEAARGAWFCLPDSVVDGRAPFEIRNGKRFWEDLRDRPEVGASLHAALDAEARLVVPDIVRALSAGALERALSLVDVGGGNGRTATSIAQASPNIKCSVLDLPHVVSSVQPGGPVQFIAGDMFVHVPPTDAVLVQRVLHDWADADCVRILKRCRDAIADRDGVVIIVEILLNEGEDDDIFQKWKLISDMWMFVLFGGKERSRDDMNAILGDAGLRATKMTPLLQGYYMIEASAI